MTGLVLIGGGRFALEIATYAADLGANGDWALAGVVDDGTPDLSDFPAGLRHLGGLLDWLPGGHSHLIAIGDPVARWKAAKLLEERGARFATLVHPQAWVAPSASVAAGAVIAPFAFVGPKAAVEHHAALNVQSSLGHDARLGRAAVLAPGAKVNGRAQVGDGAFVGSLAALSPGTSLGAFAKLGAGSVLSTSLPDCALGIGNPARGRVMFRKPA